jgi:hypothetical protein
MASCDEANIMTLILLGKHPITGEKWWYHTENGLRPFTPEEMDLKKAMDIEEERRAWEVFDDTDLSRFHEGDGIALSSTAHPIAPWYLRLWWWVTRRYRLNPKSLETIEIELDE